MIIPLGIDQIVMKVSVDWVMMVEKYNDQCIYGTTSFWVQGTGVITKLQIT